MEKNDKRQQLHASRLEQTGSSCMPSNDLGAIIDHRYAP
jgi:hypothetical protein